MLEWSGTFWNNLETVEAVLTQHASPPLLSPTLNFSHLNPWDARKENMEGRRRRCRRRGHRHIQTTRVNWEPMYSQSPVTPCKSRPSGDIIPLHSENPFRIHPHFPSFHSTGPLNWKNYMYSICNNFIITCTLFVRLCMTWLELNINSASTRAERGEALVWRTIRTRTIRMTAVIKEQ